MTRMATQTVRLATVYPPEPGNRQQCADCLKERLLITPGVRGVEISDTGGAGATIELEYDPGMIPPSFAAPASAAKSREPKSCLASMAWSPNAASN